MCAQTRKSNGYYGGKWPGDHDDYFHLRGNGFDVRIGPDGTPELDSDHRQEKLLKNYGKKY